jgi:hypothetical protein
VNGSRIAAEITAASAKSVNKVCIAQPLYTNGVTLAKINMPARKRSSPLAIVILNDIDRLPSSLGGGRSATKFSCLSRY